MENKPSPVHLLICLVALACLTAELGVAAVASSSEPQPTCDPNVKKLPNDYAAQQKKYNFSVVYTDCRWPEGKAVLIIPLSIFPPDAPWEPPGARPPFSHKVTVTFDRNGDNQEWPGVPNALHYHQGCLYNSAKLKPTPDGFTIGDELMGGLYEQNSTKNTIRELLRYPFHYLPPDRIGEAFSHRPERICHSDEGW